MSETTDRPITACILVIGNEILSGRTQDLNVAYIAKGLGEIGIRLREVRIIPDVIETIVDTVNDVRARFDYVFTTGGIGPTHDDITADCVAKAFGVPLLVAPEARRRLEDAYRPRGIEINEARLRMARIPQGGTLVDNPVSAAPGFRIGNVFVMAGVPMLMRAMLEDIEPQLKRGALVHSQTVAAKIGEGKIAAGLMAIQKDFPDLAIGSYPYYREDGFGVQLVARGRDAAKVEQAAAAIEALIRSEGAEPTRV